MNNIFVLMGRITKDLELRYTKEGKAIMNLPLAIANGKDDTTFITLSVFGILAETINKYCKKGDMIGTSGIIKNNNWNDKDGNKHYDFQFIVSKANFVSIKKQEQQSENKKEDNSYSNIKSNYEDENSDIVLTDNDLPF